MKILEKLRKIFKKEDVDCELEGHCPIYLSYLGKGVNEKNITHCNKANKLYCKKHRLVDIEKWEKLSIEEKLRVINDMDIKLLMLNKIK